MASANGLSSFSSGGGGGWSSIQQPHFAKLPTAPPHQDHGIIHNFLTDLRDSAVGIPMGFIDLSKGSWDAAHGNFKPLEDIGHGMANSYSQMYGPAFHGHFGQTLHMMGQHPLQPLLDAISIATLPAAGIGAGIKAVDTLGAVGERLGVVSAERAAAVERAANFFRPRTTLLAAKNDAPSAFQHWSGNPTNRAFQGLSRSTQLFLAQHAPSVFGPEGMLFDTSAMGMQTRALNKMRSAREHAASAQMTRELAAVRGLFKNDSSIGPDAIANALAPHIDEVFKSHAFKVAPNVLSDKRRPLADGWAFIAKSGKYHSYPETNSVGDFGKWITGYTQRKLTPIAGRAQRDEFGNYLVVRTQMAHAMRDEAARTHKALKLFYDNPTKVWKWMVLATAPRYFVNNVIGNGLMVAMAANPVDTTRGMYHTVRQMHGERAARKSMTAVEKAQRQITGDSIDKWYMATTEGFGHDVTRDLNLHEKVSNPALRKAIQAGEGGLFGVTHTVSDTIPRRMLINLYSRRTPEYQAAFRAARRQGESRMAAHNFAIEHSASNPAVRDWVTHQVNNVLGEYHHFTRLEKGIKRVVPFYSWDRAIMRHAWTMAAERPVEAQFLTQLGQEGTQHTEKMLGHVPDFLKGVIPMNSMGILGNILGHHHSGRTSVLSTQGANPYATVPDVADFVASLVHGNPKSGEALAGQANPIITGTIEHFTGQSLLSGKKMPQHGGLIQDLATNVAEATPWVKTAQIAIQGRPHAKINPTTGVPKSALLYRGDLQQQGLSLLGIPVKDVSLGTAHKLYNQDHGIKTPHVGSTSTNGLAAFKALVHSHSSHRVRKPRKPSLPHSHHGHHNTFLHLHRLSKHPHFSTVI